MSTRVTEPAEPKRRRQPRMPIEVRREQVLDAALRVVMEHGYAAATMEAIARKAELAKPRVYTAYPGRGPLLHALLVREQLHAVQDLADAMPELTDDADFDETLRAAARNLLTAVAARPTAWRLLMLPAEDGPREVREHSAKTRRYAVRRLRELLEWGRERREGLAELDVELMAYSLLAAGEQAVRLLLANPKAYPPHRFDAFVGGVLARFS